MSAAAQAGVPLALLDVRAADSAHVYRHKLVLNRPDGHVAWRGNDLPADPAELIDLISGRKAACLGQSGS
jgi:hypothetical protein